MARIAIHISSLNHCTETLAWQFALRGHQVELITAADAIAEGTEHATCSGRVARMPCVTRHGLTAAPIYTDLLVLALPRHRPARSSALDSWVARTRRLALLLEGPYHGWRDPLRELVRAQPYPRRADIVIRQQGSSVRPFYPFIRRHRQYAPYVHPVIFNDPRLLAVLSRRRGDEEVLPARRLTFIGSREPVERGRILGEIMTHLKANYPQLTLTDDPERPADIFWMHYDIQSARRGVAAEIYLSILRRSTFCLSPAGWGGLWTHRTIEALASGAIPILPSPEDYALDLRDGEHCVAVHGQDWRRAVDHALRCSASELARLQANIAALWSTRLAPAVAAERQTRILGF